MDIAVTGSSGLIGTALRHFLPLKGHRVVPVVRRRAPGTDEIGWDPAAGAMDSGSLEGVDAVIHLAGASVDARWTQKRKELVRRSRIEGTDLVARTLGRLQRPPRVLLSASAIGYYGDRGNERLDETSAPGDDFMARLCQDWEAASAPASAAGIRVANLRSGIVMTPEAGALGRVLWAFKLGLGGKLGKGRQYWSWISIDDEVAAIEFLLTADVSGPVNLVGPSPVTNAEWTRALGEVLGRPAVLTIPKLGPRLLLGWEGAANIVEVSQRVKPAVLEEAGYWFRHEDVRSCLRAVLDEDREIA